MSAKAPFTTEQVEAIQLWQSSGACHDLNCSKCGSKLFVKQEYLYCNSCDNKQYFVPDICADKLAIEEYIQDLRNNGFDV